MSEKRYTDDGLMRALQATADGKYLAGLTEVKHIAKQALDTIYALRDELARAYTDLADMHEGEGYHNDAKRYRARATLASADRDGAGTAAGDATAGDGDGDGSVQS